MINLKRTAHWAIWTLSIALITSTACAEVRLPNVFSNNMVLQRDKPLPFWGWADPGEKVTVRLGEQSASATAGEEGRWKVELPAMEAGGPYTVAVNGKNRVQLRNVLIGEVWVCSGQSNMEWPLTRVNNAQEEIALANHPQIRLFNLDRRSIVEPADDVSVTWQVCTPETVSGFSAVGFFFGRHLRQELNVPIGLIDSSWGGTRIEPWTPPEGFAKVPEVREIGQRIPEMRKNYEAIKSAALASYDKWMARAKQAAEAGDPIESPPSWPTIPGVSPTTPTALYNGMIAPFVPYAVRGAIWYQGESNRADGMAYHAKMKALIAGWRTVWNDPDMPFLYVQLAPYKYNGNPELLARIWEAQTATLSVPNTGMAVTTDIGNMDDIHPKNKQDVGKRLALWALAKTYGQKDLVYSGPLYRKSSREGNKIRIEFDHVGGGLVSTDGKPLRWFQIAGKDGKFVAAQAAIEDGSVLVSSDKVSEPVAVRYGWVHSDQPNLANKEGLPASPFRTDKDADPASE